MQKEVKQFLSFFKVGMVDARDKVVGDNSHFMQMLRLQESDTDPMENNCPQELEAVFSRCDESTKKNQVSCSFKPELRVLGWEARLKRLQGMQK